MLRLITGLPGAGKTQYAIGEALKEKRPVYFCNMTIQNKPAGWTEQNFKEWRSLPPGSLLLVDEVQDFALATSSQAEEWVRELAKHRHFGIDIWLITQDPKQMHAYVRRLIGEWHDLVRIFGQNAATVNIRDSADSTRPIFQTKIYRYDKKVWNIYQSATVHTSHGKVPFKLIALAVVVFVGIGIVLWKWSIGVGVIDGTAAKKAFKTQQSVAPALSAPVAPARVPAGASNASATDGCAVLVGMLRGENRAILVFETVDGSTFREAVHPSVFDRDDLTVRGCSYFIAGGSMLTRDSVSREAFQSRKRQEQQREAPPVAAPAAPNDRPVNTGKAASAALAAGASDAAILEAIKARNSDALRRAVALIEESERRPTSK